MPRLLWIAITSGSGNRFIQLASQGGFIPSSDVYTVQLQTALSINQVFSTKNMPSHGENSESDQRTGT